MSIKQNQHVEDYLDAYRKMDDVDFAVMITGPWGCGKTRFVKDYLQKKCASGGDIEYVYVSLNGINSVADIDMKIMGNVFRLPNGGKTNSVTSILKQLAKAKLNINLSDLIQLVGISERISGKLLVFDDMERCLLEPEQVLGYINTYVENQVAKVLVIGDEKNFGRESDADSTKADNPDTSKYWMIKEKVIGKTFRLTERIEEIFDVLVSERIFPASYRVIIRNKEALVRMFKKVSDETEKYNYRALKHCIRDFEYFCPKIDAEFSENKEFLDDLLLKFLTMDYELQVANYGGAELVAGDMEAIYAKAFSEGDDKEEEPSDLALMLTRHEFESSPMYPSMDNMIFSLDLWGKILRNEWVDQRLISQAIRNCSYFPDKQQEWVVLWHWRRLEDSVAEEALTDVMTKLDNLEYRSREIILHVFSIFRELAELGAISKTSNDVLKETEQYLSLLVEKKLLIIPERDFGIHWAHSGSYGLEYWSKGSDYFRQLLDLIDAAVEQATEENRQASVDSWLEEIKGASGSFLDDIGTEGKYYREPVLKYFTPNAFVAALDQMENEQKWIARAILKKRYEFYSKDLFTELPFFESVLLEVEALLDARKGAATPSKLNMEYLKKDIEIIVESLRAADKKNRQEEEEDGTVE